MTGHLIHIGYPKTGSSSLRRWFALHPQLAYAEGGVAGFQNVYQIARQSASTRPGIQFRVTSSESLAIPHLSVGEHVVDYDHMSAANMSAAQEEASRTLADLFPNAHILMVTRGFRSILLSGYSQYVRTGGDTELRDMLAQVAHGPGHCRRWDYDRMIGLYRAAFGGRVIVMPYELLRDDPERFTGEIEMALGLTHCPMPRERANPSLTPEELSWYPRLNRVVRNLPVGERLRQRILGRYIRVTMDNRLRPLVRLLQNLHPLAPVTAEMVGDELLERFRGQADFLRGHPLYAPYEREYLL